MAKYKSKDLLTKTKDELKDRMQFLRKEQFNLSQFFKCKQYIIKHNNRK